MFKEKIRETPFSSPEADECFGNITSSGFQFADDDQSFLSTLRALVGPRLSADDVINVNLKLASYSFRCLTEHSAESIVSDMVGGRPQCGTLSIISIQSGNIEANKMCMDNARSATAALLDGYVQVQKVALFYRQVFDVACFICPDEKSAILFVNGLTLQNLHYLQCGIPAYLPWYFSDKTLHEWERELIESLKETKPAHYLDCLNRAAKQYDFRERRVRRLLAGFESRAEIKERDASRNRIEAILDAINEANDKIARLLTSKRQEEIILLGLETKLAQKTEDSEIMEYVLCNKNIHLISVDNDCMKFACKDYLLYFDEDMAKKLIDNDTSYVYTSGSSIKHDDMKTLMYAIFIDQKLRIRFCAAYKFVLGQQVDGISHYEYGSDFDGYMPNPHIDGYACLGNYRQTLNEMVQANDYIGAIEQCMASCKSLNFGDSIVMSRFMGKLYGSSTENRCIELPDGTVVTPKKAISWLKEQEEAETNE